MTEKIPVRVTATRFELTTQRQKVSRLPTEPPGAMMFGEMVGGAGCVKGQEKERMGVSWTTSELSASTPINGRLQPGTKGNGVEWQNKGGTFNISW